MKAKGPRPKNASKAWPFIPRIHPSAAYLRALRSALAELRPQVAKVGSVPHRTPVNVEAHFYLGPRQAPDFDGLLNACGDILEAAGVIPNDYWISSWDRTRRHRDTANPRTEVTISIAAANIF